MIYELYVDVLFGHLFVIELAALAGTTVLLRRRRSAWRIMGCAAVAAASQCAALLLFSGGWRYVLSVCLLLQPLAVWMLFAERTIQTYCTDLAVCFLLLLLLGGLLEWLYGDGYGYFGYEMAMGIALGLMTLGLLYVRERRKVWSNYHRIVLSHRGRRSCLRALVDSGNLLTDPYTGKVVSMVDRESYEEAFGDDASVRLVPFESLGCAGGLLPVVTVDFMRLSDGRILNRPALGLAEHGLFAGKDYQMIVNLEALHEECELRR